MLRQKLQHIGEESPVNIDPIPVIRVQPVYPMYALEEKTEGYCIVEFDVTEVGYTDNLKISHCSPVNVFEEFAMSAVAQFVYMPALVDWSPAMASGLKNKISFKLVQSYNER